MQKKAQYPYNQVGLAPGLPEEIEAPNYANPNTAGGQGAGLPSGPNTSKLPHWALPAGIVTASGLLGYLLLKGKGGRAARQAAETAASGGRNIAETATGAIANPVRYHSERLGETIGGTARKALAENPDAVMRRAYANKDWSILPEGRNPKDVLRRLNELANETKTIT